jgi:hypothetical protein
MKRVSFAFLVFPALVAAGCPVYDDGCFEDSDCGPGYLCTAPGGECVLDQPASPTRCSAPAECSAGETCDRFGRCSDDSCTSAGCVDGFACTGRPGAERCTPTSGTGGAAGAAGEHNEGGAPPEAGAPNGGTSAM